MLICIACSAVLVNSRYVNSNWNFCLAAAILVFLLELSALLLSATFLGQRWVAGSYCSVVVSILYNFCSLVYSSIKPSHSIFLIIVAVYLIKLKSDKPKVEVQLYHYVKHSSTVFSLKQAKKLCSSFYKLQKYFSFHKLVTMLVCYFMCIFKHSIVLSFIFILMQLIIRFEILLLIQTLFCMKSY